MSDADVGGRRDSPARISRRADLWQPVCTPCRKDAIKVQMSAGMEASVGELDYERHCPLKGLDSVFLIDSPGWGPLGRGAVKQRCQVVIRHVTENCTEWAYGVEPTFLLPDDNAGIMGCHVGQEIEMDEIHQRKTLRLRTGTELAIPQPIDVLALAPTAPVDVEAQRYKHGDLTVVDLLELVFRLVVFIVISGDSNALSRITQCMN